MIDIKINNNNNIPNFINIAYYHLKCNTITNIPNTLSEGINTCLKNKKYTMLILEYFDGDIYSILIQHRKDNEIIKCIYSQLLLSIYLFHNKFNYYHNDAHLKNFLYKKVVNDNKYYHYNISTNNYYIKNEGYVIVLSDFGLSTKIEPEKIEINKIRADYYHILFYIKNNLIIDDEEIKTKFMEYLNPKIMIGYNELDFLHFMMTKILNIETNNTAMTIINNIPYN